MSVKLLVLLAGALLLAAACSEKAQSETPDDGAAAANSEDVSSDTSSDAAETETTTATATDHETEPDVTAAAPAEPAPRAVSDVWIVDMGKSKLGFTATQTGDEFDGAFNSFTAKIRFDPDHLESASIDVSIDMNSARTGDRQRDLALPEKEWFNAKSYPEARFVSHDVVATGDGAYEARGTLTIRNVSKDVTLPFTVSINGDKAQAEGALTIVRTDYGVGQGEWESGQWVGLNVKVEFSISAHRAS